MADARFKFDGNPVRRSPARSVTSWLSPRWMSSFCRFASAFRRTIREKAGFGEPQYLGFAVNTTCDETSKVVIV